MAISLPDTTPDQIARRPFATRFARAWPAWGPMLLSLVYMAPFVPFLLPATQDSLGEIYQPLQALKFFATRGTTFHPYGPAPNFVLAPVYGPTLAYWYATGSLSKPSDDFPYGFSDPVRQLGILIFEHRLVLLMLGLAAFCFLGYRLELVTNRSWARALAMIFCVATSYPILVVIPTGRPDSLMLTCLAAALGVYLAIVYQGLTPARAFWLSTFAVLSISSKEITAFVFVPSYLGLAWTGWWQTRDSPGERRGFLRSLAIGLLTGVLGYALMNIVYAPHNWWRRMEHWLAGPGLAPEVWGATSRLEQVHRFAIDLMTNLGPGGTVVVAVAIGATLAGRPRHLFLLSLPPVGALWGYLQVRYGGERFLTPLTICLVPLVAAGLGQLLSWPRRPILRAVTALTLILAAITNVLFAGWCWIDLYSQPDYALERYARAHVPTDRTMTTLSFWPVHPGSTRLEWLGYAYDGRPYQEWTRDPSGMPDVVFITQGSRGFLNDMKRYPERARLFGKVSGFDFQTYQSLEELGYRLADRIVPASAPSWFPTSWMPWAGDLRVGRPLLVYVRDHDRGASPGSPSGKRE
jgi:hypothetical protein